MDVLSAIGLALPAGLNAYIPLLGLALAERFGVVSLSQPWDRIGDWWVIAVMAALLGIEVLADKFPVVDHVNDLLQSVVRPAAGAVVAVAASGQAGENYPLVMVLLGVVLAGGVHSVKASARPVVNTASGGTATPLVSAAEDVFAAVSTALALFVPVVVVGLIALFAWAAWRFARRRPARAD